MGLEYNILYIDKAMSVAIKRASENKLVLQDAHGQSIRITTDEVLNNDSFDRSGNFNRKSI